MGCWRPLAAGIEIAVKMTPRSAKGDVAGIVHDASGGAWLDVRVTAAPEGGRATKAAMQLVAQRCDKRGVPWSSSAAAGRAGSACACSATRRPSRAASAATPNRLRHMANLIDGKAHAAA